MLQINSLVKDFLYLLLEDPLNLSPVSVHKGLWVTQALVKKRLELVSHNWDKSLYIIYPLVLLLAETDPVLEEEHGKGNPVSSRRFSGSEIVFTLLKKVRIVYIGLSAIYIWGIGLQWLILRVFGSGRCWGGSRSRSSSLQNDLKNLLQVILTILKDISNSGGKLRPWKSIGLFENCWLRRWKEARVSNRGNDGESDRKGDKGSNGEGNRGSGGGTLLAETTTASDWGYFGADFFLKHSSKWAGWPIGYGKIRIVKKTSLIPGLVTYNSKDIQYDWIKCLRLK